MLESGEGMQDDKLEDMLKSDCLNPGRFNAGAGKSGFCHAVGGQSGRHSKSSASGIYPNVFWHRVRSADL